MNIRCVLFGHKWQKGASGTLPAVDVQPPGAQAVLPTYTDIDVTLYHCVRSRCENKVRAVARWGNTTRRPSVDVSVAWALHQLSVAHGRK